MLRRSSGTVLGIDFGAPARARNQRRKIVAIEAEPVAWRQYRIRPVGLNGRLLSSPTLPGWSAKELLDELLARPVRVAAFDFPFSLPEMLLRDRDFAAMIGEPTAFMGWRSFSYAVASRLSLSDPLNFAAFAGWRAHDARSRLWLKRATDVAANAQPPLKDGFQSVFKMTLLGNHLLSKLWESKHYRVIPFGGSNLENEVIEIHPGATLRCLGMSAYKGRPDDAIHRVLEFARSNNVHVDVDRTIRDVCVNYNSGRRTSADHDAADALVATVTGILYCEGLCAPLLPLDTPMVKNVEGTIWAPRPS